MVPRYVKVRRCVPYSTNTVSLYLVHPFKLTTVYAGVLIFGRAAMIMSIRTSVCE